MPDRLLFVVIVWSSGVTACTVASTTAAPDGSVTVPRMLPLSAWANTMVPEHSNRRQDKRRTYEYRRRTVIPHPNWRRTQEVGSLLARFLSTTAAEAPRREHHSFTALRRCCQDRFDSRE